MNLWKRFRLFMYRKGEEIKGIGPTKKEMKENGSK